MFQRWVLWPIFTAIIGFALGGSYSWAIHPCVVDQINDQHKFQASNDACPAFFQWVSGFVTAPNISAFGAIAVAAFTWLLWNSTHRLWIASERQHISLQDQIDLTFRPRIRVRHIWLTKDIWGGERVEFTVVIVNVGSAEAFLREIGVSTFVLGTHEKLPADPTLREVGKFNLALTSLRGGQSLNFGDMNDWRVLTETQRIDMFEGRARLYCVGYISYQDRRGGLRRSSFCRVLEAPREFDSGNFGRLVKCDDPDYEYED